MKIFGINKPIHKYLHLYTLIKNFSVPYTMVVPPSLLNLKSAPVSFLTSKPTSSSSKVLVIILNF